MSGRVKKTIGYAVCTLCGLLITGLCLYIQDFSFSLPKLQQYLCLSNAFTVAGTLILGLGLLIWIANLDGFMGLGYAIGHTVRMLIPGASRKDERYYDYVMRKREHKVRGYGFILVTGIVFMAAAVVFMLLFNKIY